MQTLSWKARPVESGATPWLMMAKASTCPLPVVMYPANDAMPVTYKGAPLGFVKNIGNRANNLYPAEWRIRKNPLEL